ncbi:AraC family transcriptional regulator [Pseudemcibacter aquimaris]|uniref:AraC family transcriptional regulator n=1 Tax=Pseudemcibacter aquimaris TaxID=2857064 RepID=UPI00201364FB|nr:AraC family transcriptional regulator [Pseudemcibacter aquimaris]MCC3862248.1 AraC family transcriptional regulator [Pseudemcibacter aquimaris]WDU59000.1 AraC family transcriptional regulator [Pseudemcibacter aquimaris]
MRNHSIRVGEVSIKRNRLKPHVHDALSIGIIDEGVCDVSCASDRLIAGVGSVTIINPGVAHDGADFDGEGLRYSCINIPKAFIEFNQKDCVSFLGEGPDSGFIVNDPTILTMLKKLYFILSNGNYDKMLSEEYFELCLSKLIDRYGRSLENEPLSRDKLKNLKCYLKEECQTVVELKTLSDSVGMHPTHLIRSFKRAFGLSPYQYLMSCRIEKAMGYLLDGMRIADTAIECGFVDQSHFHRHFKKSVGLTPGQYIRSFTRIC